MNYEQGIKESLKTYRKKAALNALRFVLIVQAIIVGLNYFADEPLYSVKDALAASVIFLIAYCIKKLRMERDFLLSLSGSLAAEVDR